MLISLKSNKFYLNSKVIISEETELADKQSYSLESNHNEKDEKIFIRDSLIYRFSPIVFLSLQLAIKKKNYLTVETQRRLTFLINQIISEKRKKLISFLFLQKKGYLLFQQISKLQIKQQLIVEYLNANNFITLSNFDFANVGTSQAIYLKRFLRYHNPEILVSSFWKSMLSDNKTVDIGDVAANLKIEEQGFFENNEDFDDFFESTEDYVISLADNEFLEKESIEADLLRSAIFKERVKKVLSPHEYPSFWTNYSDFLSPSLKHGKIPFTKTKVIDYQQLFKNRNVLIDSTDPFLIWKWKDLLSFDYLMQDFMFSTPLKLNWDSFFSQSIDLTFLEHSKSYKLSENFLNNFTQKYLSFLPDTQYIINKSQIYFDPIPLQFWEIFQQDALNYQFYDFRSDLEKLLTVPGVWPDFFFYDAKIKNFTNTKIYGFNDQINAKQFNSSRLSIKHFDGLPLIVQSKQSLIKNTWLNWSISFLEMQENYFSHFSHPFKNIFHSLLFKIYTKKLLFCFLYKTQNDFYEFWNVYTNFQLQFQIKNNIILTINLEKIDLSEDFLNKSYTRINTINFNELAYAYPLFLFSKKQYSVKKYFSKKLLENSFFLYDWYYLHFYDARWQDFSKTTERALYDPSLILNEEDEKEYIKKEAQTLYSEKYFLDERQSLSSKQLETYPDQFINISENINNEMIPKSRFVWTENDLSTICFDYSIYFNEDENDNQFTKFADTWNTGRTLLNINTYQKAVLVQKFTPPSSYLSNFFQNFQYNNSINNWFFQDCQFYLFSILNTFFKSNTFDYQQLSLLYSLIIFSTTKYDTKILIKNQLISLKNQILSLNFKRLSLTYKTPQSLNEFLELLLISYAAEHSLETVKKQKMLEFLNQLFFFRDLIYLCEEPLGEFWYSFFSTLSVSEQFIQKNFILTEINNNNVSHYASVQKFLQTSFTAEESLSLLKLLPNNSLSYSLYKVKSEKEKFFYLNEKLISIYTTAKLSSFIPYTTFLVFKNSDFENIHKFLYNYKTISRQNIYRKYITNSLYFQKQIDYFIKYQSFLALILYQYQNFFFFSSCWSFFLFISLRIGIIFSLFYFLYFFFIQTCIFFLSFFLFFGYRYFYFSALYNSFIARIYYIGGDSKEQTMFNYEVIANLGQHISLIGYIFLPEEVFLKAMSDVEEKLIKFHNGVSYYYSHNILEIGALHEIQKLKNELLYWGMPLKNDKSNRNPLFYVRQLSESFLIWQVLKKKTRPIFSSPFSSFFF